MRICLNWFTSYKDKYLLTFSIEYSNLKLQLPLKFYLTQIFSVNPRSLVENQFATKCSNAILQLFCITAVFASLINKYCTSGLLINPRDKIRWLSVYLLSSTYELFYIKALELGHLIYCFFCNNGVYIVATIIIINLSQFTTTHRLLLLLHCVRSSASRIKFPPAILHKSLLHLTCRRLILPLRRRSLHSRTRIPRT